jgi:protein TonB
MLGPLVLTMFVAYSSSALPIGAQAGATQQPPAPPANTTAEKPWPPDGVVRTGAGVIAPRVIKETKPNYTAAAMRAGVSGSIMLEAVVGTDGRVRDVRVKRSLDRESGLDDEAIKTVKKWIFEPGTKDGVAVPVLVEIEMSFSRR